MQSVVVHTDIDAYKGNAIFAQASCLQGSHAANTHWLPPYQRLYEVAAENGLRLSTSDVAPATPVVAVLYLDLPLRRQDVRDYASRYPGVPQICLRIESPVIRPEAFNTSNLAIFDHVISFAPADEGRPRYSSFRLALGLPAQRPAAVPFAERNTAVIISSDHRANVRYRLGRLRIARRNGWIVTPFDVFNAVFRPTELYSLRRRMATALYRMGPEHIAVYGAKWDWFPGWRGILRASKLDTIARHRFNICFENCPGHRLSEKLFDALLGTSVPVYLGDQSIDREVRPDCFVDRRRFRSDAALAKYLVECPERDWLAYREAGEAYLESEAFKRFLPDAFATAVVDGIKDSLSRCAAPPAS